MVHQLKVVRHEQLLQFSTISYLRVYGVRDFILSDKSGGVNVTSFEVIDISNNCQIYATCMNFIQRAYATYHTWRQIIP